MARQVFYDPFGARTTGYQQGVKDEINIQDQTRRADAYDYNAANMRPLELQTAQRANTLGEAALPYAIDNLGIQQRSSLAALAGQELPQLANFGQITGDMTPFLGRSGQFASGQYLDPNNVNVGVQQFIRAVNSGDPRLQQGGFIESLAQQYGLNHDQLTSTLARMPSLQNPTANQSALEYYGYDRARQGGLDQQAMQQQQFDYNRQMADYQRLMFGLGMRGNQAPQQGYGYQYQNDFPGMPQQQMPQGYPQQQGLPAPVNTDPLAGQMDGTYFEPPQYYDPATGTYGTQSPQPYEGFAQDF